MRFWEKLPDNADSAGQADTHDRRDFHWDPSLSARPNRTNTPQYMLIPAWVLQSKAFFWPTFPADLAVQARDGSTRYPHGLGFFDGENRLGAIGSYKKHSAWARIATVSDNGMTSDATDGHGPPIPRTFFQYVRSMGPGVVIALTWLGAGDLVDSAVSGGNYGYALMWAMALALFVRFVFVSIIAKYQLCNQHGESVLAGLRRIHPFFPIVVGFVALVFAHFYGSFSVKGAGETTAGLFGIDPEYYWDELFAVFWVLVACVVVMRGLFHRVEKAAYVMLGLLSVSLIGVALWVGPDPVGAAKGIFALSMPDKEGAFGVLLVVTSLIGAVGGSIANLLYPYFIQEKGWKGPRYRRLQLYDLAFGTLVVVVLNLSVWTVGAQVLHPKGLTIDELSDLTKLLTQVLGALGGPIFYLGTFAALFSTMVGNATGYGFMLTDIVRIRRSTEARPVDVHRLADSWIYRVVAGWCLLSPLVWCLPGMPSFVTLTVVVNAATVVVLPLLAAGLWYVTASERCIGPAYKNRWWENGLMAGLFVLACWGGWKAMLEVIRFA